MDKPQMDNGFARFMEDWKRIAFGLPLSDEPDMDAAPEGMGTLTAQAMAAEIAVNNRRDLIDTQRRLHRPGKVFA